MGSVAVLGASAMRHKFGNKAVRAYLQAGWTVYPVNLAGGEIEGLPAYSTLAGVPTPLDRVVVYLPPETTFEVLPEIAAKSPGEVWFNPGAADRRVRDEAESLGLQTIDGCSIIDIGLSPAQFPG